LSREAVRSVGVHRSSVKGYELRLKRRFDLACVRIGKNVFGGKRAMRPMRGFIGTAKLRHFGEELITQRRRELVTQASRPNRRRSSGRDPVARMIVGASMVAAVRGGEGAGLRLRISTWVLLPLFGGGRAAAPDQIRRIKIILAGDANNVKSA